MCGLSKYLQTTRHWSIWWWCIFEYITCAGRKREYLRNGCELGRHTLGLNRYHRKLSIGTVLADFSGNSLFWRAPPDPIFPWNVFFRSSVKSTFKQWRSSEAPRPRWGSASPPQNSSQKQLFYAAPDGSGTRRFRAACMRQGSSSDSCCMRGSHLCACRIHRRFPRSH